jgi:Flp pilus assembly protein TadG
MRNYRIRLATKKVHRTGLPVPPKGDRSCQGQTLIEISLVLMTFFLLTFALMDFSWLMFNQMNMQDAVREAGRYAATGNHLANPGGGTFSRITSITNVLDSEATNASYITSVTINSLAGGVGSAGGPNDTVTITAACAIPLLTTSIGKFFGTDNKYHFTVRATFKNEPFPPSQT